MSTGTAAITSTLTSTSAALAMMTIPDQNAPTAPATISPRSRPPRPPSLLAVVIPFGAAASPDLTILPVFLAATAAGVGAAIGSLVVFAAVTIATIVGLTVFATAGGYQVRGAWLDRWGNAFTAVVLLAIGSLVLAGVL
jgi:hypothetical protein